MLLNLFGGPAERKSNTDESIQLVSMKAKQPYTDTPYTVHALGTTNKKGGNG